VTWSINGEETQVDSIKENNKVTSLPDEPTSCSTESNVFMGWTTAPISGSQDDAPAVLYKAANQMPAVTADITLYAVFAHAQTTQTAAPATYTYDSNNQDGWSNTGTWTNGTYWLLDDGKSLVSPEIDLAGLSSIAVTMRTYGGPSYNQLAIKAGTTDITTIVASSGKTMTDYSWTNSGSLTGKSPLTFTCGNAVTDKGIGFESVTINATGAGVAYSRYITSCQTTTEVAETQAENVSARKILVGGQIYLQIGDNLYNLTGQKMK
nr:hypothetical protein [Paludibacteraceae bacterium]